MTDIYLSGSTAGLPHAPDNSPGIATIMENLNASIGARGNNVVQTPTIDSYDAESGLIEGTGAPGATIVVLANTEPLEPSTIVEEDGTWAVVAEDLEAETVLIAQATSIGGQVTISIEFEVE